MRDLNERPYTEDEKRVCFFLQSVAPDLGCGDDPIGFLMASHASLAYDRQELRKLLKIVQWGFNHSRCPVCAGWECSPSGETDYRHTATCPIGLALRGIP